jgi:hypothetical protein
MTEDEMMLEFAMRIERLEKELIAFATNVHSGSLWASHELGTAALYIQMAAAKVRKVAKM